MTTLNDNNKPVKQKPKRKAVPNPVPAKDRTRSKKTITKVKRDHRLNPLELSPDVYAEPKLEPGSPDWCIPFLEALELTGVVTAACRAVGIAGSTPYKHAARNPAFELLWKQSERIANDALVLEARKRALQGHDRPIYQRGELVGTEKVYSDSLLIALLKAKFPEEFADRFVVKISAEEASVLRFHGLSPDSAWKLLLQELGQEMQQAQQAIADQTSIGITASSSE